MEKNYNNGGYYALKGLMQQYNHVLLKFLENVDRPDFAINLEILNDFETEEDSVQVKYHEAKNYSKSLITEPVQKLFCDFKEESSLNPVLLCYFKNKNVGIFHFTVQELKTKFALDSVDGNKLNAFSKRFRLEFGSGYQDLKNDIVERIEKLFFCDKVRAKSIYSTILIALFESVSNNPPGSESKRRVNTGDLFACIGENNRSEAIELVKLIKEEKNFEQDRLSVLPNEAKQFIKDAIADSKKSLDLFSRIEINPIADRLERKLFVSLLLKRRYYYPILFLYSPIFKDKREKQKHQRMRDIFRIDEAIEDQFLVDLQKEGLIEFINGVCVIKRLDIAKEELAQMLDEGAIDIETLLNLIT